jgi:Putative esterase
MLKQKIVLTIAALLFGAVIPSIAVALCSPNATIPPGANTTDPTAPWYIDTTFMDLSTQPPTRHAILNGVPNPIYPPATVLPDTVLPSKFDKGNFIIGPTHPAAPENTVNPKIPQGQIVTFTMTSLESLVYNPGLHRDEVGGDCAIWPGLVMPAVTTPVGGLVPPWGPTVPSDPSNMIVPTSRPGTWTRTIHVYIPSQLDARSKNVRFLVVFDAGFFFSIVQPVVNNMIHEGRIPPMVVVGIDAGGQDAQGSQRGFEYDTVSGTNAEWIETEVLPLVEKNAGVGLTKDPDRRVAFGISSSGVAAWTMAWFRPDLYRRIIAYSPTVVNQQWPHNPALRGGAWEYHSMWAGPTDLRFPGVGSPLILNSPKRPIIMWFDCGDRDLFYYSASMADGMHDWTLAAENLARVLAEKNYDYQFIFSQNAAHVDLPTMQQTLPLALEWIWQNNPEGEDSGH